MTALILFVVLAQAEFPPIEVPVHPPEITAEYDEVRDSGSFDVEIGPIMKDPIEELSVELSICHFYKGKERKPIPLSGEVSLHFFSRSETWTFLKSNDLNLLVDGSKRLHFQTDHHGDVGRGYVTEHLWYDIPVSDLVALANAVSIEGEIGFRKFKLSNDQRDAVRCYTACLGRTNEEILGKFQKIIDSGRLEEIKREVESALNRYETTVSKLDKRSKHYDEQVDVAERVLASRIKKVKKDYGMTEDELVASCKDFKGIEKLLRAAGYK